MEDWNEFLQWERVSRDTIDFKRIYVDMAGSLEAGLLLSQIVYWHLGDRLRVQRNGKLWVAKSHTAWWDEVRLTEMQVRTALEALKERGLVEVGLYYFQGRNTTHIRIIHEGFLAQWKAILEGLNSPCYSNSDPVILTGAPCYFNRDPVKNGGDPVTSNRCITETTHRLRRDYTYIWREIVFNLENLWERRACREYMAGSELLEVADGYIRVRFQNKYKMEWVMNRAIDRLKAAAEAVLDRPVEIRGEV